MTIKNFSAFQERFCFNSSYIQLVQQCTQDINVEIECQMILQLRVKLLNSHISKLYKHAR